VRVILDISPMMPVYFDTERGAAAIEADATLGQRSSIQVALTSLQSGDEAADLRIPQMRVLHLRALEYVL